MQKSLKSILILGSIVIMQLAIALPQLNTPFVDGRLYCDHSNTFYLKLAKDSNTLGGIKDTLGLSEIQTGTVNSTINNIIYHKELSPLPPTLLRIITKLFGYNEWLLRSLAVLIQLATTTLIFTLLLQYSRSGASAGLLTFLYTLLPLTVVSLGQWHPYSLATLLLLLSVYALNKSKESARIKPLIAISLFLAILSDWTLVFPALFFSAATWIKRADPLYRHLGITLFLSSAAASTVNFAVSSWLNTEQIIQKSPIALSIWEWLWKQFAFFEFNFGQINICIAAMLGLYCFIQRKWQHNTLIKAAILFFIAGAANSLTVTKLSDLSPYPQFYWTLSYILLIAGIAHAVKTTVWTGKDLRRFGATLIIPVLLTTAFNAYKGQLTIQTARFGDAADIRAIAAIDKTLIYHPAGASGPIEWWDSRTISWYTGEHHAINAAKASSLEPGQVIVLLNTAQYQQHLAYFAKSHSAEKVRYISASPNFLFFEIL